MSICFGHLSFFEIHLPALIKGLWISPWSPLSDHPDQLRPAPLVEVAAKLRGEVAAKSAECRGDVAPWTDGRGGSGGGCGEGWGWLCRREFNEKI